MHLPTSRQGQLLKGRVSITSHTVSGTPGSTLIAEGALGIATAPAVVDEDGRGLLLTRSTIRTPITVHAEETKHVEELGGLYTTKRGVRREKH